MDQSLDQLDELLSETRRALERMRSTPSTSPKSEMMYGNGEAADGRVRAKAVTGGRLASLEMDPRALRMGSEELCEHIISAVNAALDDLRSEAEASVTERSDAAALDEQLSELQSESARQMRLFSQGVSETLARISVASGQRRG